MATLSSSPSLFTRFARSRKTRSVASDSASSRSTSSKESLDNRPNDQISNSRRLLVSQHTIVRPRVASLGRRPSAMSDAFFMERKLGISSPRLHTPELLTPPLSPSSLCSSDSGESAPTHYCSPPQDDVVIADGDFADWVEQARILLDGEPEKTSPYIHSCPSTGSFASFHTTTSFHTTSETIIVDIEPPRPVVEEPVVAFRISTAAGPWLVRPHTAADRLAAYEVGIDELQHEGPTWWNEYASTMRSQGFPPVAPVRRTRRIPVRLL